MFTDSTCLKGSERNAAFTEMEFKLVHDINWKANTILKFLIIDCKEHMRNAEVHTIPGKYLETILINFILYRYALSHLGNKEKRDQSYRRI